jgi:predicted nucleotidyltransferase component of viral defense system
MERHATETGSMRVSTPEATALDLLRYLEQDLVICRAVVDLFSDELLAREVAFRGGTALDKIHFNPPGRYSEDIDRPGQRRPNRPSHGCRAHKARPVAW